jgi:hypothetical protein
MIAHHGKTYNGKSYAVEVLPTPHGTSINSLIEGRVVESYSIRDAGCARYLANIEDQLLGSPSGHHVRSLGV